MQVVVKKKEPVTPLFITTEFIKLQDAMKYANVVFSGEKPNSSFRTAMLP